MPITTDYLVVGAGASGLAFADTLAAESDVEIVLVDRRDAPGGHWVDAYPFVVLHSPSALPDRRGGSQRRAARARSQGGGPVLLRRGTVPAREHGPGAGAARTRPPLRRRRGAAAAYGVRRIEADRALLEGGEVRTGPDVLHVDCTARGLRDSVAVPVFAPGRIVLQPVRYNSPTFNAALIAFVEAHRDDDEEKNRLCPPHPFGGVAADYPRVLAHTCAPRDPGCWSPASRGGWGRAGSTC